MDSITYSAIEMIVDGDETISIAWQCHVLAESDLHGALWLIPCHFTYNFGTDRTLEPILLLG